MIREQSQCFQFYYEFLDQGPLCVEQHSDTKIIVVLKRSSLEQTKTPSLFIGWGGGRMLQQFNFYAISLLTR